MRINIKRFFLTIILPTLLTIGLFVLLIFRFIIPYFEQNMLNQKKEMIRELISSSVSIAETFRRQALAGKMSAAAAQAAAPRRPRAFPQPPMRWISLVRLQIKP